MHMQQTQLPHQPDYSWLKDIIFLLLVLGGIFFLFLGGRPLFVPDEGRYAEIAREMVESGNYVTPYLNGIKYFEKPVLFYWLESAAIYLGGLNLWSLRSVNALLGLFGCLFTYYTGRTLYNRRVGLISAFILGTSTLYFVMSHMISLDLPVTVFISISLYSFLLGINNPPGSTRRLYLWGASIAAACAVLTKGLIGIVFPIMIIALWLAVLREWRLLLRLYLPSCIFIFLLITVPWHILVGQRNPEFFYFYFIKQHFLRYTTMKVGHYQPIWFFIPNLIIGFFPWIVFLPQAIAKSFPSSWKLRSQYKFELFFLIWALLIFIFFSFSKSKLIPYILPVFPPLAILTARYLDLAMLEKKLLGIKIGFAISLLFSILISIALIIFPHKANIPDPEKAAPFLYLAAIILTLGSFTAFIYCYRNVFKSVVILITTSCLFLVVLFSSMPFIDGRTVRPLAQILKPILTQKDEVVAYNQYFQDLPFYLQRRITILNWKNELKYGMEHQDTREWMISDDVFWQRWNADKRVFVVMGMEEYQNFVKRYASVKHYLLGQTQSSVLFSNRE